LFVPHGSLADNANVDPLEGMSGDSRQSKSASQDQRFKLLTGNTHRSEEFP